MEEVGAQVASPIFIHHALPNRFREGPPPMARKRDLPFQAANFHRQQQQFPQRGFQNTMDNWNPNVWDWDSTRFVAKPLESDVLHLGTRTTTVQSEQTRKEEDVLKKNTMDVDDESLSLKLGGGSDGLPVVEEHVSRSNKRVRSGSPGSSNYPMCQVDTCREDLSTAKDYHRRHKVCEVHSKATKALVGKQMQRFCQQCSRFHPLSEFDEGKRSCRRRLAGHNRRRRKTQPEDVTSRLLVPGSGESPSSGNFDIVNLLAVLAHAQGNKDQNASCSSVAGKDQLIQILSKINSLPFPADFASKLPIPESLIRSVPQQASSEYQNRLNGNTSARSTMDLLTVLSANQAASAPDALANPSQSSSRNNDGEQTRLTGRDQPSVVNLHKGRTFQFPSLGGARSGTSYQSPVEDSDCQVQETRVNLPLQLFSSSPEDDSPPKLASASKYFSSDSSNPMDERSPSSSPVVQKLFPVQSSKETVKPEKIYREVNENVEVSRTHGGTTSLELFGVSNRGADIGSFQSSPYQGGYSSSSGSDHSPSSLISDAQDRTGRIIFKLFDKDPSHFPGTLKTQIYNWLSTSPSEMESYIRPGCVVLSIYASMSPASWDQLEENLFLRVSSLVQDIDTDFWRNGRFLVQTARQLASHKNGKIRLCKSWRTWRAPELTLVSPLAVVGGQETSLVLRGRNLTNPGTKIHCTYMGGYSSTELAGSISQGTIYDEISLNSLKFNGATPSDLGRCFIEVENGFKGNSFPVIIADAPVCRELRLLESEIDEDEKKFGVISEDPNHHNGRPRSREEVLHFLNELGWLFQRRKRMSSVLDISGYLLTRFRFLLTFSVERDYCALVKSVLDILVEGNMDSDGLSHESIEMLSEVQLLNRAVKRRSSKMVDLLINYSLIGSYDGSKKYIFPPNLLGPAGITPLHLAACTSDSDDIIDSLTNDPLKIGLNCWKSLLDVNGQSPYAYAMSRNNHSYNRLVAKKLGDRRNGQVSVSIDIEQPWSKLEQNHRPITQFKRGSGSCTKCAVVAAKVNQRSPGTQGLLHRPFVHSMLAIAAVCVCVCLFLRGSPNIGLVAPFKWENLGFGTS